MGKQIYSEQEFLRRIEEEFSEIERGILKPADKLKDILEWDSFNALMFLTFLSMDFEIDLEYGDIEHMETLNELYTMICLKLQ